MRILDINISTLTKPQTLTFISNWLQNNEKGYICTVNPEFLLLSQKDLEFKNILNNSKLNVPDGVGLIFASKFLKTDPQVKERITGSDLFFDIIKISAELNKKIFLLGGNNINQLQNVENRIDNFCRCQMHLAPTQGDNIISGSDIGFKKNESIVDEKINDQLINQINNSGAEIIFVAYGAPKQEKWIYNNLEKLKNIKLAIGVGGTFDFISNYKKRAPVWMQHIGLEWLFRLIQEPKRIKRIFNAVIKFPIEVLKEKLK